MQHLRDRLEFQIKQLETRLEQEQSFAPGTIVPAWFADVVATIKTLRDILNMLPMGS